MIDTLERYVVSDQKGLRDSPVEAVRAYMDRPFGEVAAFGFYNGHWYVLSGIGSVEGAYVLYPEEYRFWTHYSINHVSPNLGKD